MHDTRTIRSVLEPLKPGDAAYFEAPGAQPFNRNLYLRINAVAHSVWGVGQYQMQTGPAQVGVIRKARR